MGMTGAGSSHWGCGRVKHKMTFAVGAVAGYVLGTRAGRERYEQIRQAVQRMMESPQAQRAKEQARIQANDLAGRAKDKAGELADKAKVQAGGIADRAKEQAGRIKDKATPDSETSEPLPGRPSAMHGTGMPQP